MKNNIEFLLLILILIFLSISCKKDSVEATKISLINYENKDYQLSQAYIETYGKFQGIYRHDLTLLSSGVQIIEKDGKVNDLTGIGHGIGFGFYSISDKLQIGEYRFDVSSKNYAPNTMDYGGVTVNYDFTNQKGVQTDITGGVINITRSDIEYEISFNCVTKDGKKVIGYYKGAVELYK